MYLQRSTGIIIKVSDYGESDKIVTFYCPKEGKLTLIAKGANRSKKRFVNKLELFTHLDLVYNCRYALALLDQADLQNGFPSLRQDYRRYAASELLCEHMLHWSSENDGDISLFMALRDSLNTINNSGPIQKTIVLFLIHLYNQLGYQPNLLACSQCGKLVPTSGPFYFQQSLGTIICHQCSPAGNRKNILHMNTIKLISQAQKISFAKSVRLQFSSQSINQSLQLFQEYGNYLLDRRLNSWDFLTPASISSQE